jgi:hypothetical protein
MNYCVLLSNYHNTHLREKSNLTSTFGKHRPTIFTHSLCSFYRLFLFNLFLLLLANCRGEVEELKLLPFSEFSRLFFTPAFFLLHFGSYSREHKTRVSFARVSKINNFKKPFEKNSFMYSCDVLIIFHH